MEGAVKATGVAVTRPIPRKGMETLVLLHFLQLLQVTRPIPRKGMETQQY
jgi:hypothetical protein